jgi:PAS domain S-box-containing protein
MNSEPRRDERPQGEPARADGPRPSPDAGQRGPGWDRALTAWDDRLLRALAPSWPSTLPVAWRYAVAILLVGAAAVLRRALVPWMGTTAPYNLPLLAQVLVTVLLGIGPGLASILVGDLAVEALVVRSLPASFDGATLARFGASIVIGVSIASLVHAIRAAAVRSRQSEARLTTFGAATFEGIVESDAGCIVDCNPQFAGMVGRRIDELMGMPIAGLVAPEDRERVRANIDDNRESVSEHAVLRKDGSRVLVEAHGRPVAPGSRRRLTAVRDVTERRRMETALRLAATKYSVMFDTTSDGVWIGDLDGRTLEVNDAYCRMSGYRRDELVGMPITELEANESPEEITGHIRKLIEGGGHDRFESRHRRKDGTLFDADITALQMEGEGGRIAIFVRDVTDRKRAEAALRESLARRQVAEAVEAERRRLFEVLETLPAMVCLLTPDYHVAFANRAFREKFGESHGRHCYEYCYGRPSPCEFCESYGVLRTGQPHRWEVTTADGSVIEVHDLPFTDVDGSPLILEMDWDITERRKAESELARYRGDLEALVQQRTTRLEAVNAALQEEIAERGRAEAALRETRDYFQNLIDYANAPIIVWNPAFQVTRFNHAFERLTGRRAADVIGRELQMLFPDATRETSMGHIRRTATGERWETLEIPVEQSDGRVRTVLWNSATLFDADGKTPIATIAQGQDITDRKRLEEDLREAAARLAEANRLKDEFLSTLSHELRTPLNAIIGWTQMLLHQHLDPDHVGRALEVIDRNARAQVSLVEDVLDVSRIISGNLRLAMRRVDLVESVHAALDAVHPAAEAKSVEIVTELSPDVALVGDPDRLQQICWNLLSNAVKFTAPGGRVKVRMRRTDSHVELRVEDNGIGIAPEFLPHVFERFRQADSSTTRQQGGLGLGLAIVRHLVELHGGRVTADSAGTGLGATFTVTLPAPASALPGISEERHPEPISVHAGAPSLAGLRVLVVDDDPDARDLLGRALSHFGAEVRTAGSAQAGVEGVRQWRPDVLLADIGMPDEDGYGLLRRVRALPPQEGGLIPVAALTAYGGAEERLRALAAGFQQHLLKPVVPHDLARAVLALVSVRQH